MPYLIDGNNLMAQVPGWRQNVAAARKWLVRDLVEFVAAYRVKVKVVFDGIPDEKLPDGISYKGVTVLYATPGSDADSRIKSIIASSSHKRDLIVVSSDQEIAAFANCQGAKVCAAHEFRTILDAMSEADHTPEKKRGLSRDEVLAWLEYFRGGVSNSESQKNNGSSHKKRPPRN